MDANNYEIKYMYSVDRLIVYLIDGGDVRCPTQILAVRAVARGGDR